MEQIIQITLIPLALMIVQAIKLVSPKLAPYAIGLTLVTSIMLSLTLVDWSTGLQAAILSLFTFTVQVAAGASGVYSWGKKGDTVIELQDYSDEK